MPLQGRVGQKREGRRAASTMPLLTGWAHSMWRAFWFCHEDVGNDAADEAQQPMVETDLSQFTWLASLLSFLTQVRACEVIDRPTNLVPLIPIRKLTWKKKVVFVSCSVMLFFKGRSRYALKSRRLGILKLNNYRRSDATCQQWYTSAILAHIYALHIFLHLQGRCEFRILFL